MKILQVINKKNNVLINDSQGCAFLKYRLTFSGANVTRDPAAMRGTKIGAYYWDRMMSLRYPRTNNNTCIRVVVPIRHRTEDEVYIYAISSDTPIETLMSGERFVKDTDTNKWVPCFTFTLYIPATSDPGSILRGVEIYVYSNKPTNTAKYGMEVFDEKGNPVFNSANYYLRAKDTYFKEFQPGQVEPSAFSESRSYDVSKLGITLIRGTRARLIGIDGTVVSMYPQSNFLNQKINVEADYNITHYIVSELDQHKHFPVSVDLGEI